MVLAARCPDADGQLSAALVQTRIIKPAPTSAFEGEPKSENKSPHKVIALSL